jgi:hypothetical protein
MTGTNYEPTVKDYEEIGRAILEIIEAHGGQAPKNVVVQKITEQFQSRLSATDLSQTDSTGMTLWEHRLASVHSAFLRKKGYVDVGERGLWKITGKGRLWLREKSAGAPVPIVPSGARRDVAMRSRHDELIALWRRLGERFGYNTEPSQNAPYRHDVVWRRGKREPFICMEICDSGNLDKDLAALQWATDPENWGAKCALAVADEQNRVRAERRLGRREEIWVMTFEEATSMANLLSGFGSLFRVLLGVRKAD